LQGAPREGRPGGDPDGGRPRPGRARDRDVPRGDTAAEGAAQEVQSPGAHRCGPDRDRGGRAACPGGDQGHRRPPPAPALARALRRPDRAVGRPGRGDRAADGADPRARGVAVSAGVLLAIDGDSLAHRAYHALPKSIRLKVLVGWDTLEVPTYRHEALPQYQSGRVFERSILDQLEPLPALVESFGFLVGKAPGYEADDFLAASARAWPGRVLVATSDRDAFQLVSDRVTVLQPVKGVSELARIG